MSLIGFYKGSLTWDNRGLISIGDVEFHVKKEKGFVDPSGRFAYAMVGPKIDQLTHPYIVVAFEQLITRLYKYDVSSPEVTGTAEHIMANAGDSAICITSDRAWYFQSGRVYVADPNFPVAFGTGALAFIGASLLGDDAMDASIFASYYDEKTSANITVMKQKDLKPFHGNKVAVKRGKKK